MELEYKAYTLDFTFDAGTSRGIMRHRTVWFLQISDENGRKKGVGEIAPLPRLSIDPLEAMDEKLDEIRSQIKHLDLPRQEADVFELAARLSVGFPSVRMGLEMAFLDALHGGKHVWFPGSFTEEKKQIPINGLIWMGSPSFMREQADKKIDQGFACIKLKIGAIDFREELALLDYIRKKSPDCILRVDANGAFAVQEALGKLKELAALGLHSIEQPIMPRQPEAMALLCQKTAVPIALDEELVGWESEQEKNELLDEIKPQFVILKPSLLGGFDETARWIRRAGERNIGWWVTSALESNIGLNAISQFTARYDNALHQGLGTGQLFHNNVPSPIGTEGSTVRFYMEQAVRSPFD